MSRSGSGERYSCCSRGGDVAQVGDLHTDVGYNKPTKAWTATGDKQDASMNLRAFFVSKTHKYFCNKIRKCREKPDYSLPRGSYPTPFLGYLVLWLGSVILKSRRPKKGVGYEPIGRSPEVRAENENHPDGPAAGIRFRV